MTFQLLSRPRPEWGHGLAFAAALGVVFGVWAGLRPPFKDSGAGQDALVGGYIFAQSFLAGMMGASIASLIARPFDRGTHGRTRRRVLPWHVGAVILLVEVAVVVVMAVIVA